MHFAEVYIDSCLFQLEFRSFLVSNFVFTKLMRSQAAVQSSRHNITYRGMASWPLWVIQGHLLWRQPSAETSDEAL